MRRLYALSAAVAVAVTAAFGPASPATAASDPLVQVACPPTETPVLAFHDTLSNAHRESINCIAWYGISAGVRENVYAPSRVVPREQMASFVARTMEALDFTFPAATDQGFTDIPASAHRERINQLAMTGITTGTSATTYAPKQVVRRDQMATFLVRAYEKVTGTAIEVDRDHFIDDNGTTHETNIDKAAAIGIANGVTADRFGPAQPVRRDQMASFLARMLGAATSVIPGGLGNPWPLGTTRSLADDWELTVVSGTPDATQEVLEENQFNEGPENGHQFFLARVRATYTGGGSATFDGSSRLRAVGSEGAAYSTFADTCGVIPDPIRSRETFSGGTIEGNVCWEIRSSDADSLVLFDDSPAADQRTREYFSLS